MDWVTKAALIARQLTPTMSAEYAYDLADSLYMVCEPAMGPAEAMFRFFSAMPPGWTAQPVPMLH